MRKKGKQVNAHVRGCTFTKRSPCHVPVRSDVSDGPINVLCDTLELNLISYFHGKHGSK